MICIGFIAKYELAAGDSLHSSTSIKNSYKNSFKYRNIILNHYLVNGKLNPLLEEASDGIYDC
jgi:hypothetical protein